jgi:hypothetical protein
MAPFSKAIRLEAQPNTGREHGIVYRGNVDPEWVVVMYDSRFIISPFLADVQLGRRIPHGGA